MNEQKKSIFSNHEIMCRALKDSFIKLNPRTQIKNPVMFMVFVSAILTFVMFLFSLAGIRDAAPGYILPYPSSSGLRFYSVTLRKP